MRKDDIKAEALISVLAIVLILLEYAWIRSMIGGFVNAQ